MSVVTEVPYPSLYRDSTALTSVIAVAAGTGRWRVPDASRSSTPVVSLAALRRLMSGSRQKATAMVSAVSTTNGPTNDTTQAPSRDRATTMYTPLSSSKQAALL